MSAPTHSGAIRFRIGTIPVDVLPGFLLMTVFFAYSRLQDPPLFAIWFAVVFVSILVHELGHALAFLLFGHKPRIELYAMGGLTYGSTDVALPPAKSIVTYLSGPLAGFALGGVIWVATRSLDEPSHYARVAIRDLLWVNIGWGAFNLLPILPLDGGGILRGLLVGWRGEASGGRWADASSTVFASAAALAAFAAGWTYAALLAAFFAVQSGTRVRDARTRERMTNAFDAYREHRLDEAIELAGAMRNSGDSWTRRESRRLIALAHLQRGDGNAALEAIGEPLDGRAAAIAAVAKLVAGDPAGRAELARAATREDAAPEITLLAGLLTETKRIDALEAFVDHVQIVPHEAMHHLERAFWFSGRFAEAYRVASTHAERFRCSTGAYNAACASLKLGEEPGALRWLTLAVDDGLDDLSLLDTDDDIAPLRARPEFAGLRARAAANPKRAPHVA